MKIYISLPISGKPEKETREKADRIKAALSRAGHTPVNPFDIYAGDKPSYADYLCADLLALYDCDAIFLCEGWQFSRGCRIERMFAEEFCKTVMYENKTNPNDNYYFNR